MMNMDVSGQEQNPLLSLKTESGRSSARCSRYSHRRWPTTDISLCWPCAGSASDLAKKDKLGQYQPTEVLVIFDRYDDRSAKDHERIRRAGEGAVKYNIKISSKLPCRDAIMKSKANKMVLVRVLSIFNLGNNVTMVGREESMYSHDEADIAIISYLLEAVKNGKNIVR